MVAGGQDTLPHGSSLALAETSISPPSRSWALAVAGTSMVEPSRRMTTVPAAGAAAARSDRATPSMLVEPEAVDATSTRPAMATHNPMRVRAGARSPNRAQPAAERRTGWLPDRVDATAATDCPAARYMASNASATFVAASVATVRSGGTPHGRPNRSACRALGRPRRALHRVSAIHTPRTAPPIRARSPARRRGVTLGRDAWMST